MNLSNESQKGMSVCLWVCFWLKMLIVVLFVNKQPKKYNRRYVDFTKQQKNYVPHHLRQFFFLHIDSVNDFWFITRKSEDIFLREVYQNQPTKNVRWSKFRIIILPFSYFLSVKNDWRLIPTNFFSINGLLKLFIFFQ